MKLIKIKTAFAAILFTAIFSCINSTQADSIFFEGFEDYTTSNPTDWARSSTTLILVVTNGEYAVSTTQKVASGLRSVFIRDGVRNMTLRDTAAVNANSGTTLLLSFKASQNAGQYEGADYIRFYLKFGTNDLVEAIYDPAKLDGCGTASSPIVFDGTRIDLPAADGYETNFVSYFIKFTMPADSDSLLMKFAINGSSNDEDYWIDDINVEKILSGTYFIIQ